jgi:hypothetical protein
MAFGELAQVPPRASVPAYSPLKSGSRGEALANAAHFEYQLRSPAVCRSGRSLRSPRTTWPLLAISLKPVSRS